MDDKNLNNQGINPNSNNQHPQDNPYYNPYFNNDLNSPYFSNDNSTNVYENQGNSEDTNLFNLANESNSQEQTFSNDYTEPNASYNNEPTTFEQSESSVQNNFNQNLNTNFAQNDFNQAQNVNTMQNDFNQNLNTNFAQNDFNQAQNVNTMQNDFNQNLNTNFAQNDFNQAQNQNPMQQDFNQNDIQYGSSTDEEFIKAWMGNLYAKANSKFSIPAFFFGGYYFVFRKMYLSGLLMILVNLILSSLPLLLLNTVTLVASPILLILLNIGYGFAFYPLYKKYVKAQLQKIKAQSPTPNELLNVASKKGGTSIGIAIVSVIVSSIVATIIFSLQMASFIKNLLPPSSLEQDSNTSNNLSDTTAVYDTFNFYKDYCLDFDTNKWTFDDDKLENDGYSLAYIQSIENLKDFGFDMNTSNDRASFFTFLYNQFSSQVTADTSIELGSSSFIQFNGVDLYYAYLDLIYPTSMDRCYFLIIPEDDIMLELILTNSEDTVIYDPIHTEILTYLSSVYSEPLDGNNELGNDINSNSIDTNAVSENIIANETTSNNELSTVSNSTSNNVVSENVSSNTLGNTVSNTNSTNPNTNVSNTITNRITILD